MADQELSIQIETNAKKAVSGLDEISESIKRIESTLSGISGALSTLGNIGKTTARAITNLADTIKAVHPEKFSELSKAITNSAQAAEKTGDALKKTAAGAEDAEQAISRVAKSLARDFNISGAKNINAVKDALREYYNVANELAYADKKNIDAPDEYYDKLFASIEKAKDAIRDIVGEVGKFGNVLTQEQKDVLAWIKSFNTSGSKVSLSDIAQEYVDDFSKMRATLGKAFSSSPGGLGFDVFIKELNETLGTNFSDNMYEAFGELVDYVRQAKESFVSLGQSIGNSVEAQKAFNAAVDEISKDIYDIGMNAGRAEENINLLATQMGEAKPIAEEFGVSLKSALSGDEGQLFVDGINRSLATIPPSIENAQNALGALGGISLNNVNIEFQNVADSIDQKCLPAVITFQDALMQMAANGSTAINADILQILADIAFRMDAAKASAGNFSQEVKLLVDNIIDLSESLGTAETGLSRIYEAFDNVFSHESPFEKWTFPHGWSKPLLEDSGIIDVEFKEIEKNGIGLFEIFEKLGAALIVFGGKAAIVGANILEVFVNVGRGISLVFTDIIQFISALDPIANKAISAFKTLGSVAVSAFKMLASVAAASMSKALGVVTAPFVAMGKIVEAFGAKVQETFAKMRSGWARVMRTFKFMLVRKAITAIIKSINEAMKSLARFDEETGHRFNQSMSLLVSDFKYLGASIVGAFAPLINAVVPYIDALIEKMVEGINIANEFFAALTGADKYTIARKVMTDYAESTDEAAEAQNNFNKQLASFDKLNVLRTDSKQGKATKATVEWDEKEVSASAKKVADRFKKITKQIGDILKDLFKPLKGAWNAAEKHLMSGFNKLIGGVKKLASQIGSDFMRMWREKETQHLFENLLHTIGYLGEAAGILGNKLATALAVDDRGLHIWEALRNVMLALSEHLVNMASATKEWAENLNLNPVVEATEKWLESLVQVADFIGGIGEDIYTKIILPFAGWTVETGIPELMRIFTEFNNTVDWDGLREHLNGIWVALEKFGEGVGAGLLNFIRGLSEVIRDFVNSDNFKNFLDHMAELIPAFADMNIGAGMIAFIREIVDAIGEFIGGDVFTDFLDYLAENLPKINFENMGLGIAKAISEIASELMEFVLVPAFKGFINLLVDFSSQDPDKIARQIKAIAEAILAIKFTHFVVSKVTAFINFLNALPGVVGIAATVAAQLTALATAILVLVKSIEKLMDAMGEYSEMSKSYESSSNRVMESLEKIYKKGGQAALDETTKAMFGVKMTLEEARDALEKTGGEIPKNLFQAFSMGWDDYFGENGKGIIALAGDAFGGLIDGILGIFGIASPSKVMKDIGENVTIGFDNGMFGPQADKVVNDTTTFMENIIKRFKDGLSEKKVNASLEGIPTAFQNAFQRSRNNIQEIVSRISDIIESFVRKTKRSLDSLIAKMEKVANASSGSGTFEIPEYATGGIVPSGQIFMARENGVAEMVGSMGGHVAVANNDQIVSGIAQGVYSAVKRAMMDGGSSDGGDIVIQMDGNEIYRVVRKRDADFRRQTGFSGFAYG